MSRRALQSCCIDNGTDKGKDLLGQISELFTMGIITKDMKEWATTIRWIGNDAAHINDNKVNREDAEEILNLADELFKIIYVAPAIAKERQAKRKQSSSKKGP